VKGQVLSIPRCYFFDREQVRAEMRAAVESALHLLEGRGIRARVAGLPDMDLVMRAWNCIAMSEAYAYREKVKSQSQNYGYFSPRARAGVFYSAADYIPAQRVRMLIQRQFATAMTAVDAFTAPVWPRPAGAVRESGPCEPGESGLELGVQLYWHASAICLLRVHPQRSADQSAHRRPAVC
jgi:aspartyl-tRNA(Asn)/glutamyl-tRNA(Gln) amidotransferase subunit A